MDVDVGEEVGVHERVVGFRVFAGDADVFVLSVPISFAYARVSKRWYTILKVTTFSKEISPALYFSTRILYILTGEEPVGRPRTKGCSGVGAKALILS